jgi:hypothetical protein
MILVEISWVKAILTELVHEVDWLRHIIVNPEVDGAS